MTDMRGSRTSGGSSKGTAWIVGLVIVLAVVAGYLYLNSSTMTAPAPAHTTSQP